MEEDLGRTKFYLPLTAKDNFNEVAPLLGLMPGQVEYMSLEQVGLVESNRISMGMVHPIFNQAIFLKDDEDLDETLCVRVTHNIGGLIFRVLVQEFVGGDLILTLTASSEESGSSVKKNDEEAERTEECAAADDAPAGWALGKQGAALLVVPQGGGRGMWGHARV